MFEYFGAANEGRWKTIAKSLTKLTWLLFDNQNY